MGKYSCRRHIAMITGIPRNLLTWSVNKHWLTPLYWLTLWLTGSDPGQCQHWLGGPKWVWDFRGYGLSGAWAKRVSTVVGFILQAWKTLLWVSSHLFVHYQHDSTWRSSFLFVPFLPSVHDILFLQTLWLSCLFRSVVQFSISHVYQLCAASGLVSLRRVSECHCFCKDWRQLGYLRHDTDGNEN